MRILTSRKYTGATVLLASTCQEAMAATCTDLLLSVVHHQTLRTEDEVASSVSRVKVVAAEETSRHKVVLDTRLVPAATPEMAIRRKAAATKEEATSTRHKVSGPTMAEKLGLRTACLAVVLANVRNLADLMGADTDPREGLRGGYQSWVREEG